MERLEFGEGSRYSAVEASIHLARYLAVRECCRGRRVLDVACGEGYGSYLMAGWGARSVDGVDVSESAIEKARSRFAAENVRYLVGSGEALAEVVGEARYDLVVSFETIEHVDRPSLFLENLAAAAAPGATIVVSCPNDPWHCDRGGENPFHKHRFTWDEFRTMTEEVLGRAASWHLGTLAIGCGLFMTGGSLPVGAADDAQELLLRYSELNAGAFVPMEAATAPSAADVAFYLGVWGPKGGHDALFIGFPVSMAMSLTPITEWVAQPRAHELEESRARCLALEAEKASLEQRLAAVPWNVVAVWRRVRRIFPAPLIRIVKRIATGRRSA